MPKTTIPFYPKNTSKRKFTISPQNESDKPIKKLKTANIPVTKLLKSMIFKVEEMVQPHLELTPPGDTKSISFNNQGTTETSPTFIDLHETGSSDDAKTQNKINKMKPNKNMLKHDKRGKITDFFNCTFVSDSTSEDKEKQEVEEICKENQVEPTKECNNEAELLRILNDNFLEFINTEKKPITAEQLDLSYFKMFNKSVADNIYQELEKQMEYFTGELTRVNIRGQWKDIPRKQVAYGDDDLTYTFSGNTLPTRPWVPLLETLCRIVSEVAKAEYNFVLVNRYNNGQDHIGEHRDDEPDLDPYVPIASMSFGQEREFLLRHKDLRFKKSTLIPEKRLPLEHGSLLLMNYPTNNYWYHSLPRCSAQHPRINLTFRKILPKSEQTPYVKKTYQGSYHKYGNTSYSNKERLQQKIGSTYQPKPKQWKQRTGSPYQLKDKHWQKGAKSPYQLDNQDQSQQGNESAPSQQENQWQQSEKPNHQEEKLSQSVSEVQMPYSKDKSPSLEKPEKQGPKSPYEQRERESTNSPNQVGKTTQSWKAIADSPYPQENNNLLSPGFQMSLSKTNYWKPWAKQNTRKPRAQDKQSPFQLDQLDSES